MEKKELINLVVMSAIFWTIGYVLAEMVTGKSGVNGGILFLFSWWGYSFWKRNIKDTDE